MKNLHKIKNLISEKLVGKKILGHQTNKPQLYSTGNVKLKENTNLEKIYNGEPHKFNKVQFKKENIADVIKEVKFDYYYYNEPLKNKYKDIPLNIAIIKENELPAYVQTQDQLHFSVLENDLRIISTDRGSSICSIGLYVNCGSRNEIINESVNEQGLSVMIENMSFHSTAHLSHLRTIKTLEKIGAHASCNAFREHIVYSCECLKEYLPIVINLLIGNVLFPRFLSWEMKKNENKLKLMRERLFQNNEMYITELLHNTAWHNNTLGNKLYMSEGSISNYTGENLRKFMMKHFSPKNMTLVGINVDHDELTKWTSRAFLDYNAIPYVEQPVVIPKYTGGFQIAQEKGDKTNIAIAYQTKKGWKSSDFLVLSLLQNLMGGGGSFSTGGPGKGMYSRLFLKVLNYFKFVDTCMAFSTQYSDDGLFGLYFTGTPQNTKDMIKAMGEQFNQMGKITDEELNRAKNSLKSFVHMSLEYKSILMEDLARQMMILDRILSAKEICQAIDEITKEDIARVVQNFLKTKPTVVIHGDVNYAPHYEEVCQLLA